MLRKPGLGVVLSSVHAHPCFLRCVPPFEWGRLRRVRLQRRQKHKKEKMLEVHPLEMVGGGMRHGFRDDDDDDEYQNGELSPCDFRAHIYV